jgi:hypothetical protein
MSTFPITYPEKTGSGRLTQIFTIPTSDQNTILKENSASANKILQAKELNDRDTIAILIDSPPSTQTEKLKGLSNISANYWRKQTNWPIGLTADGKMSYSFIIPQGSDTTPEAKYYLCNLMKATPENQPALAAALDAYLRGIFSCGAFKNAVFHHIAVSREDPEIIVSLQGWPSKEEGKEYWDVSLFPKASKSFTSFEIFYGFFFRTYDSLLMF